MPRYSMDGKALFVIDVQEGIAVGPTAVPDATEVNNAITSILNQVRQSNDLAIKYSSSARQLTKIIFVQHDDQDPNDPLSRGKDTWRLVFQPHLSSPLETLVSKDVGDVFTSNPTLASSLRLEGISELVIVGLQTDCCVRSSIMGALASGFEPRKITLLRGTHSTFDQVENGKSYLQVKAEVERQLADIGVRIVDWESFQW